MKVFLDTNVIIDHIFNRQNDGFADEITKIFDRCEFGIMQSFASSASFFTMQYLMRKKYSKTDTAAILENYLQLIEPIGTTKMNLLMAIKSDFRDLEDAFQYQTALNEGNISYFLSGNLKDFRVFQLPQLPVISPADFLKLF